ncbi:Lipoprotein-releasing system ATP-binding protein LolD [Pseudovibrio axinellae]|uniref:Lipoprotein-releasing system ATP-binding protein LolD n=1 Tax=Pseudovibrio axinellae TaxID=989403 RepID=A0A161VBG6_9HYPH|nr:ATP-binding cassette domain-containing protein [Pseudovibrio axinellae]KZL21474.1 Lipoprotein-releasing system ATP-binding protein LolD [Pseudovibrio axinellae]SER06505.1 putative ABC transport system ATP-binding protein/putative ABC transport system ATP-binding protein [Pseudovibrio axinellae]
MPAYQDAKRVPLIEARSISVTRQGHQLFKEYSFKLYEGDKLCLSGPSGRGKTVLLRILAGLDAPDSGQVFFNGMPYTTGGRKQLYKSLNWLPQRVCLLADTIRAALVAPFEVQANLKLKPTEAEMRAALTTAGLPKSALAQATQSLSGGERQRLVLARALLLKRPLWIADEPTAALDKTRTLACTKLLLEHAGTLLLVTHDPHLHSKVDKVIELPDLASTPQSGQQEQPQ